MRSDANPQGPVLRLDLGNLSDTDGAALLHARGATRAGAAAIGADDPELLRGQPRGPGPCPHPLAARPLSAPAPRAATSAGATRCDLRAPTATPAATPSGSSPPTRPGSRAGAASPAPESWPRCACSASSTARPPPSCSTPCAPPRPSPGSPRRSSQDLRRATTGPWSSAPEDRGLGRRLDPARLDRDGGPIRSGLDRDPARTPHAAPSTPTRWCASTWPRRSPQRYPDAWREGHRRLYERLKGSVPHRPEGLDGLQPLYQAVAHGCLAGLWQEACDEVYVDRILRGTGHDGFYSIEKLGAFGADLGAVACLFAEPWSRPAPALSEPARAWLLNEAAFHLRALGRLGEALEPMRAGAEMDVQQEDWKNAAIGYGNLSELQLTLGRVAESVADARRSVEHADRSGDAFQRMVMRTTLADALHQRGETAQARAGFVEAESMQAQRQPQYPLLYSLQGFRYCDLLLAGAERAAWGGRGLGGDRRGARARGAGGRLRGGGAAGEADAGVGRRQQPGAARPSPSTTSPSPAAHSTPTAWRAGRRAGRRRPKPSARSTACAPPAHQDVHPPRPTHPRLAAPRPRRPRGRRGRPRGGRAHRQPRRHAPPSRRLRPLPRPTLPRPRRPRPGPPPDRGLRLRPPPAGAGRRRGRRPELVIPRVFREVGPTKEAERSSGYDIPRVELRTSRPTRQTARRNDHRCP